MDAGAAGGGVEDEAGGGVGVVADLGALVGGEGDGWVGFVGGDDSEAAGGEEGAEAGCEGEGDVFFEQVVGRRAPGSGPPWAGSRRMTMRGVGCWAGAGTATSRQRDRASFIRVDKGLGSDCILGGLLRSKEATAGRGLVSVWILPGCGCRRGNRQWRRWRGRGRGFGEETSPTLATMRPSRTWGTRAKASRGRRWPGR